MAKIGKVIKIVKNLGGPRATVDEIKKMGGLGEVTREHAPEEKTTAGMLASLGAELLGIADIRANCF